MKLGFKLPSYYVMDFNL